jgi:TolB-like protein/Tfp pilus assembly protein PilF
MSPERWQQIEEIFQNALDLPPSERAPYITEKCADDAELKSEVEKLLLQFEDASSFIETPVISDQKANVLSKLMEFDEDDPMLGTLLGSYRIEREIGRGGMGAVYEAVRADGEFRRKVAIKVVKRGMDTDFILRRFRNERQILATLEHPFITRLLDGGTTDDGRPYFVMDYIEGLPLYRYCDKNRLTIRERLKLFAKICEAVEYAHQNLVIHRDLKPSNILVAADGTPRLLDFGIAKLLNPELASDTLQPTATAMRMMTIDYASPEQINGEKVTFSTDIYSLGVILFELLTGHRPYRFANRTPHEIARVICEEPPSLPSYAIVRSENTLPILHIDQEAVTIGHLAELRRKSPDSLQNELRGNLDNITLKALRKSPEDRYESIKKFRDDIEKHLAGKPISAPFYVEPIKTSPYETAENDKLIAVLPLKLLNFSASENTDENYLSIGLADAIITRLTGVKGFTVRPTSSISGYEKSDTDPLQAGNELGVDFVLDGRIKKFGDKLRISLQMLDVRKSAAVWAGQFDENSVDVLALEDAISEQVAEALVTQITGENKVKLARRGTDNPQAYEAYLKGRFYWNQFTAESLPKAIECFQKAVELDPKFALAHVGVADFYIWANIYGLIPPLESAKLAEDSLKKALAIDDKLGEAYTTYGLIKHNEFQWEEGRKLHEKAIQLNPNYSQAHEWYSANLVGAGKFAEGIKEMDRAESLDPLSLRTKTLVAWTKSQARDFESSLAKAEEIIALDPNYPQGHLQRGHVLFKFGRYEEAIASIEKAILLMPESDLVKHFYCFVLAAGNRLEEARKIYDEMRNSPRYVKAMFLGYASVAVGEIDEAFKYFDQAVDECDPWLVWFGVDFKLDSIRNDKRYLELLRRMKNPMLKQFEEKFNEKKSIAVLPLKLFSSPTGSNEDEYLSIGLTDALITRLSKVGRLTVRPTSSVLPFQNTANDLVLAGRTLQVEYIVDGNIRRAGERVRVSLQLLNVANGSTVWAENFDEKFNDVLQLEDIISERVVKSLLPKLTGEEQRRLEKRGTNNVEAYQAYLRGRFFANQFSDESLLKSIECYQEAISFDPDYALPHVGIADFYVWSAVFGAIPCQEAYPKAKAEIERALKIDDSLGEAFAIKAFITLLYDWNWAEAERLIKHSLELNPNFGFAHECYSNFFSTQGITNEAVSEIKRAEELDPLSPRAKLMTSWTFYVTRRFPEAIAKAGEANNMQANFAQALLHLGNAQLHIGEIKEAVKNLRHSTKVWVGGAMPKFMLCFALAADNQIGEARKVLDEIKSLSKEKHVKPYFLGMAYAAVGEINRAFEWFNKSLEARDEWMIWFGVDAKLDKLRKDPRYLQILRQTNNPIAMRQTEKISDASKSIAVLPFQFIGEIETGEAYLSVGLADAMITRLSRIKGLTVRPTTSILRFNNSESELSEVAKELGVQFILNGHLKKFGNRLRITVQLLDVAHNSTVWAETIDETLDDVLQLEDSVCYKVLRSLTPHLTGEELNKFEKRGTNSPKAYEAYLRGRYYWHSYTVDGISKALVCYYEAIAEDENFALPYAGIADYYNFLSIFGVMSSEESFPAAKQAAEKAISLDENLAEAYTSLGITAYGYDWDFQKAKRLLEKSLSINPNSAETRLWYGYFFGIKGEHEKAVREFEKAEMLNPQSPSIQFSFALTLRNARQYEKGREKLYRALEIQPNNPTALQGFCWFVNALGNFQEAEEMCKKAVEVSQRQNLPLYAYGYTLASIGKIDEARKIIEELKERSKAQYVPPVYLALIHTALGEIDTAFEWLEKCFEVRDFWVIWLPIDPRFDALRKDKRFKEFCRRIQPLNKPDETIHQSQIETKIFTADELKATKPEETKEVNEAKPAFFYRHRFKFATAAVFSMLVFVAYATGILTIDFQDRRVGIETINSVNAKRSVAILPFKNETANSENDYLCEGLSDSLISRLSYLSNLQLTPRSTSFNYKGKNITPQQAGAEMNVETVLSGKLIKHDKDIEIAIELTDVKTGSKIWGFGYRGGNADLLFLQNKMLDNVSEKFASPEAKPISTKSYTENTEAFESYLKGEFHRQKATPEDTKKAIDYFKKALEIDPNYALAYQGLALTYRMSPAFGTLLPQEAYPLAKEAALKTLEIDPALGAAHIPLASIKFAYDWDFTGAEAEYKQAIQSAPSNAEAHYSYGNFLVAMGRTDEALNELRIAQQFDPLSTTIASNIAWALYIAGRFNEAETQIKFVLQRDPNYARAYMSLGEIYQEQGRFDESIAAFQKSKQLSNEVLADMALGHVYAMAGRKAEAQKIAAELEAKVLKKEVSPFLLAVVYAGLKENDKAFYWLERAYQERSNWLTLTKVGHRLKPLHGDPRFDDLLKRIGFDK